MCELFAMSAGHHYTAQDFLPPFADKARAYPHFAARLQIPLC
jgi:hypothetical protein